VMVDIVHWLLVDDPKKTTEEVIVVARRGPFEAKFDAKEFNYVENHFDRKAFEKELERIQPQLSAVGQDTSKLAEETFPVLKKPAAEGEIQGGRFSFRFLCQPKEIHADANGRINRLTVTENVLAERDGSIACKATEKTAEIEVDTMIFAIGDVADPAVGLPYSRDSYVTNPNLGEDPKGSPAYEIFDPATGQVLEGMYAVGWARKASDGLVGIARHDGEVGAAHVLKFLESQPDGNALSAEEIRREMEQRNIRVVDKADIECLTRVEEKIAKERGRTWFKFDKDEDMLKAIDAEKTKAVSV